MTNILVDTSAVIDFLRRKDKKESLFYKASTENIFISIITHAELYAGRSAWESTETKKWLNQFFDRSVIIPLSKDISKAAGYIVAHKQCDTLIDAIIAASAIQYNYKLVTLNVKDFKKIPNLELFNTKN